MCKGFGNNNHTIIIVFITRKSIIFVHLCLVDNATAIIRMKNIGTKYLQLQLPFLEEGGLILSWWDSDLFTQWVVG